MKSSRTKNATRNIIFGLILKIYQIVFPFIMRTVMIYFMGVKYLGLNSLFTSILQVLNLAELGVGSAMVYSMYKPIAENDGDKVRKLMNLYKSYYRKIGIVIAIFGIIFTPFIPKVIKGDVPSELNIYILYLLNLSSTVFSYWLFAYKNSILQAFQRNDLISKVTIITNTIQYFLQLLVIIYFKDYYLYVIVLIICQILTNILTAIFAQKYYPEFKASGTLDVEEKRQINKRIKDLFTARVGSVIVNSIDTIVISAFLGLTILAVYQNYYYILTALIGILSIIYKACTAGIGNSIIMEGKEKNYKDLKKFTFTISWVICICTCCLMCLYQPFMELWVGSEYLLDFKVVICFSLYFYIYEINQLLCTYKDAAGIWHEDRFRPLITALVNLILNIIMVNIWGIYGVILSTVISTVFIGTPWLIKNLFSTIFDKNQANTFLKNILKYFLTMICCLVISYFLLSLIDVGIILKLICGSIICIIIPTTVYFLLYRKTNEYLEAISFIKRIIKYK